MQKHSVRADLVDIYWAQVRAEDRVVKPLHVLL